MISKIKNLKENQKRKQKQQQKKTTTKPKHSEELFSIEFLGTKHECDTDNSYQNTEKAEMRWIYQLSDSGILPQILSSHT